MLPQRLIESVVGLFLLFALFCMLVLAIKVSGMTSLFPEKGYAISADFNDIGGLKIRAPIKIGGVQIGEVSAINLDPITYKATVKMHIYQQFKEIPDDSSAGIYTAGLLGDNYIAINPMYNQSYLKEGSKIEITHSAMVLEKLIGQFIFKINGNKNDTSETENDQQTNNDKRSEAHHAKQ